MIFIKVENQAIGICRFMSYSVTALKKINKNRNIYKNRGNYMKRVI